jgi:hypothetical protein
VTIDLVPSTTAVNPGDPVDVAVVISGLGSFASPSVGGFDLVLTFDPALFATNGLAFGAFLGDVGGGEALTGSSIVVGDWTAFEVSLLTPGQLNTLQPDSFTLFTASFTAIGSGSGDFSMTANSLSDESGVALPLDPIVPVTVVSAPPVGPVVEIPTLGSWGLLALILVLTAAALRRLRRVAS